MDNPSNLELVVYGGMAVYAVKEFLVPLVRASFARNLQAKDEQDKATQTKLDTFDKRLHDLEKAQGAVEIKMAAASSSIATELGNINGRLTALDTRIEKQGQAHDDRLAKGLSEVTTDLNRRLASTLNAELDRTVRELFRDEFAKRPSKRA